VFFTEGGISAKTYDSQWRKSNTKILFFNGLGKKKVSNQLDKMPIKRGLFQIDKS
jgi:hypothetical protein